MLNSFYRVIVFLFLILLNESAYSQTFKTGQKVEVNYNGHWYKSTILQIDGDRYKVHYEGYPASDDAWLLASYIRTLDNDGNPVSVTCSFAAPPGNFNNNSPASIPLFKRELYDWYQGLVTGGLSAPTEIGIVFKTFTTGEPYMNTVSNIAGRGAVRKHSGAPANKIIYPFNTTYFVCENYNSGNFQKEVNADFSFFINKEGEWTCSKDN
ncbi:MAG: hypothetical protein WKF35_11210 [Ferruginibacter sp.]